MNTQIDQFLQALANSIQEHNVKLKFRDGVMVLSHSDDENNEVYKVSSIGDTHLIVDVYGTERVKVDDQNFMLDAKLQKNVTYPKNQDE